MMIGIGILGGITASNTYITSERPEYPTGLGTSLGLLWVCAGVRRENKRRYAGERNWRLEGKDGDNLGDDHLNLRYTY
jgi:hypothetical protein